MRRRTGVRRRPSHGRAFCLASADHKKARGSQASAPALSRSSRRGRPRQAPAARGAAESRNAETEAVVSEPASEPPSSKSALGKGKTGCEVLGQTPVPERNLGAAVDEVRNARRDLVRGDLDAAHRSYCRAVSFDAENAGAMTGLARLLLMRRDGRPAVFWAKRAAHKIRSKATFRACSATRWRWSETIRSA